MYTTKSGDTWDVIAKEVYGSEYHADVLMAANPQEIDTFIFNAGVELNTPALEEDITQGERLFSISSLVLIIEFCLSSLPAASRG